MRIFISYRRADSEKQVRELDQSLAETLLLGEACEIFLDVDAIAPGRDFIDAMTSAMKSCDVALAVIGRHWLLPEGKNRLADPSDPVRVELRTAIGARIPVVVVLVDGAVRPSAAELPHDIAAVAAAPSVALEKDASDRCVAKLMSILTGLERRSGRTPAPGTLRLVCEKTGWLASGDRRHVKIDGKNVGLLLTGKTSEFAVAAGTHTVRLGRGLMWSDAVTVSMRPDKVTTLTYKITTLGRVSLRQ
jgi:hypothetical protein